MGARRVDARCAFPAAAMLRSSLFARPSLRFGLAFGHCSAALAQYQVDAYTKKEGIRLHISPLVNFL
jgi:hypothetical protein